MDSTNLADVLDLFTILRMISLVRKGANFTESLVSYGIDSIIVVQAAQKLSNFLGIPVGAIDIFTASCIDDLADFAEDLVKKYCLELSSPASELCDDTTRVRLISTMDMTLRFGSLNPAKAVTIYL